MRELPCLAPEGSLPQLSRILSVIKRPLVLDHLTIENQSKTTVGAASGGRGVLILINKI